MQESKTKITKQLTQIQDKFENCTKGLTFPDIIALATALTFVLQNHEQQQMIEVKKQLLNVFDHVLKYRRDVAGTKNVVQNQKQAEDRLELMYEIMKEFDKSTRAKKLQKFIKQIIGTQRIIKFAVLIIEPCLSTFKYKRLQQLLNSLSTSINTFCLSISCLILQELHIKKHPKFMQLLQQYSSNLLTFLNSKTITQMQSLTRQLFSTVGDVQHYISSKVLTIFLNEHIKQFQQCYIRNGKYSGSKWDPRVVSAIIKQIIKIKGSVTFNLVDQHQQAQQANSEINRCNFCESKTANCSFYVLEISSNSYSIYMCSQCRKILSNPSVPRILSILFINSQSPSIQKNLDLHLIEDMMQLFNIDLKLEQICFCEHNKQLKLVREDLLRYVLIQTQEFGFLWNKLWAILMILSNCDDTEMRGKAVKAIGDILQCENCKYLFQPEQSGLMKNIQKCISNRLADTSAKTRQSALNSYTYLLPFLSTSIQQIIPFIKSQYVEPFIDLNNLKSNNIKKEEVGSANILQIIQKLLILLKNNKIQGEWQSKPDQFVKWLLLISQLTASYSIMCTQQNNHIGKKSKNSKKSSKSQTNASPVQVLKKYISLVKPYIHFYKNQNQLQSIITQIILNKYRLGQNQFNIAIKILMQICGVNLQHYMFENKDDTSVQNCVFRELISYGNSYLKADGNHKQGQFKLNDIQQMRWLKCEDVVNILVKFRDGEMLWELVQNVQKACQQVQNNPTKNTFYFCLNNCNILAHLLPQITVDTQIRQVHKANLEKLRQVLITQLLPQANISLQHFYDSIQHQQKNQPSKIEDRIGRAGQTDQNIKIICKLVRCIDVALCDCKFTIGIYQNCCKIIKDLSDVIMSQDMICKRILQQRKGCEHNSDGLQENQIRNSQNQTNQHEISKNAKQNIRQKIKLVLQTMNIVLCMLPDIIQACQLTNNSKKQINFDAHIEDAYNSVKLIIQFETRQSQHNEVLNKQSAAKLFQTSYLLCKLLQISPNLVLASNQLLISILQIRFTYLVQYHHTALILSTMHTLLCTLNSVYFLQKIRNIFMFFVSNLDQPQWNRLLKYSWIHRIAKQVVMKGLMSWHCVNKIIFFGLVKGRGYEFQWEQAQDNVIKRICSSIINEASDDINQCRQLFSNFSETLKFILISLKPSASHSLYIDAASLIKTASTPQILSKKQQSQIALRPNIFKAACQHINKIVISSKFIDCSTQTLIQIGLICNTLIKCEKIEIQDWKTVVRVLMNVVEAVYFEEIGRMKQCTLNNQFQRYKQNGGSANLWRVLLVLRHFLSGVSYKQAYAMPEKFYSIYQGNIELSISNQSLQYTNLDDFQHLYEVILYGKGQNQYESDESETYDTSQNKNSNNTRSDLSTKPKNTKRPNMMAKKTKKPLNKQKARNKTAPKYSYDSNHGFNQQIKQVAQEQDVIEYKKKLRNRAKV